MLLSEDLTPEKQVGVSVSDKCSGFICLICKRQYVYKSLQEWDSSLHAASGPKLFYGIGCTWQSEVPFHTEDY